MTITATMIADSVSPQGVRLSTLSLRYPRFIHSEVMTHRAFSRNASSSRAIPIERMIQDVLDDPAMPIEWGANQPGMQAGGVVDDPEECKRIWLAARDDAVLQARDLAEMGVHKQIVNRILEPYMHINVLVSATEWGNFFTLRDHADAQPEIRELAQAIKVAMSESKPKELQWGEWHTPYSENGDKLMSVACCASVSYKTVEGKTMSFERAGAIYDKLMGPPFHASPFEHVATPCIEGSGNFQGWRQWRKDFE
jgi:thymidylate synthase ThyX